MNELRFSRVIAAFAVGSAGILGIIWGTLGQKATEKIATALAMPCGLIWYFLTGLLLTAVFAKQKKLAVLVFLGWAPYSVVGNGLFTEWLTATLEDEFQTVAPLAQRPFDYVVLLGGGASLGANGRYQGNGSGDRLILAAQLYHRGLARHFICTGKQIVSMDSIGVDPAELSTDVLLSLGVPESAIEQLGGRNTSEEMKSLGERFGDSDQRVGLVTSAWHLPRAMRLAHRNNFNPQPLPADFMTGPVREKTTGEKIVSMIPSADALTASTRACKEYLGMLVGR